VKFARLIVLALLVTLAGARGAGAQDMEPRAYSPSPVGTNFVAVVLGGTRGAILFDPAVPITDAHAELGQTVLGYGRSFGLFGRQGLVLVGVPYAWGYAEGAVQEETRRVHRDGFGDMRVKASLNLLGPKAMSLEEFRKAPRRTVLGVSLAVQAPTGEYDRTKLINLGTGRWAIKPEVGLSVPVGRWFLDAYAGAWFFETSDQFYPGDATRRQDPLYTLQAHASYTFKNRAWVAADATWYGGGASTVDSGSPSERQSNSRLGGTVAVPVTKRQSLKLAASTGTSTRTGTDFDTVLVGWQFTWFDRPPDRKP
jgi:hypothetical protein